MSPTPAPGQPTQVPVHVLQHHLTLLERSARACRELLSIAQHSGMLAQQPQVVTPDVLHRMNGAVNQHAQQAQQCSAGANQELMNVLAQAEIIQTIVAGPSKNGGQNGPASSEE